VRALGTASAFPIRRALERRWIVLLAAAAMFVAVFALRQTDSDLRDSVALLYVIPILLLSLELGIRTGLLSACFALALVGLWLLTSQAGFDGISNFSYAAAYLTVGAVGGRFADRMRNAQARHRLLLESGLKLADLESDSDLAGALVTEARQVVSARGASADLANGQSARSGDTIRRDGGESVPLEVRGLRYGTLRVWGQRPLDADDRATVAILALQAAVAAENQRLLKSERERALIQAELRAARVHLAERGGQLRELIARQEAERGHVSQELHHEAAQVLAAVLLGLKALERDIDRGDERQRWQELRSDIDATLQSLRALAISLRPMVLQLGLQAALEDLGARARARGFGQVDIAVPGAVSLSAEVQTMIYRVAEEALAAVGTARQVTVRAEEQQLVLELHNPRREITNDQLTVLKARVELVDGKLTATPTGLRVTIPLDDEPGLDGAVPPRTLAHGAQVDEVWEAERSTVSESPSIGR
jgi:signal transduction histidine kinase